VSIAVGIFVKDIIILLSPQHTIIMILPIENLNCIIHVEVRIEFSTVAGFGVLKIISYFHQTVILLIKCYTIIIMIFIECTFDKTHHRDKHFFITIVKFCFHYIELYP